MIGWSPDQATLALTSWDSAAGQETLLIAHRADMIARTLATLPGQVHAGARWSPNGRLIAFAVGEPGSSVITGFYALDVETHATRLLAELTSHINSPIAWSADSAQVAFVAEEPGDPRQRHIYLARADGGGSFDLTNDPSDSAPAWSPDGRVILFSRFTFLDTIYLVDTDGSDVRPYPGGRLAVYPGGPGGRAPRWSSDGEFFGYYSLFMADGRYRASELGVIEYDTGESSVFRVPGGSNTYQLTSFDWLGGAHVIISTWADPSVFRGSDLWITDITTGTSYFVAQEVMGYSGFVTEPDRPARPADATPSASQMICPSHLDLARETAVVQQAMCAMVGREASRLLPLIGDDGADIYSSAGYPTEDIRHYDATGFMQEVQEALDQSSPSCLGRVVFPDVGPPANDVLIIVFDGVNLEGVTAYPNDGLAVVVFHLRDELHFDLRAVGTVTWEEASELLASGAGC